MVLRWAPNPKIEVRFLAPMPISVDNFFNDVIIYEY